MKKYLFLILLLGFTCLAVNAQTNPKQKTETDDSKTKVKPKTTLKDKAHNVIHPNRKHYHGVKVKHKHGDEKTKSK